MRSFFKEHKVSGVLNEKKNECVCCEHILIFSECSKNWFFPLDGP